MTLLAVLAGAGVLAPASARAGADLELLKFADKASVEPGDQLTYTLQVTNGGNANATNVVVQDYLPAGVSVVSASSSVGPCTTGTPGDPSDPATCNLGNMPPGNSQTVTIVVTIDRDLAAGLLHNNASVSSDVADDDNSDNLVSLTTTVTTPSLADLEVTKTASPDPVIAGTNLTYEVTVTNNGPATAADVVLTDTLPTEVEYIADDSGCTEAAGTVTCNIGTLAVDESQTVRITVRVPASVVSDAGAPTTIANSAAVSATTADPDSSNNSVTETTFVSESADLNIIKLSKPDTQVPAGEQFTYTIFVENLGPSDARLVSIRDEILSSGAFTLVQTILDPKRNNDGPSSQNSPQGGQTIEFRLLEPLEPKDISNGGRWVIQLVVQANQAADVDNFVNVFTRESGTPDPYLLNNQATDFISVEAVADLGLGKTADAQAVGPGGQLTYTLTVTNNGPSAATNVVVEDQLPAGVSVVSASSAAGPCVTGTPGDPFDPTTCNLGALASGASATVIIVVTIDRDLAPGLLHNNARVDSDIFDDDNSDNLASVTTTVNSVEAVADLELAKTADAQAVDPGGQRTYTLTVTNNGPSAATNVVVEDQLPAGVSVVSASSGAGPCVTGTPGDPFDPTTCNLGTLASGASATVTIVVDVDAGLAPGLLHNNARVDSDVFDDDNSDNLASVTTTINPPPPAPGGPEFPCCGCGAAAVEMLSMCFIGLAVFRVRGRALRRR